MGIIRGIYGYNRVWIITWNRKWKLEWTPGDYRDFRSFKLSCYTWEALFLLVLHIPSTVT